MVVEYVGVPEFRYDISYSQYRMVVGVEALGESGVFERERFMEEKTKNSFANPVGAKTIMQIRKPLPDM